MAAPPRWTTAGSSCPRSMTRGSHAVGDIVKARFGEDAIDAAAAPSNGLGGFRAIAQAHPGLLRQSRQCASAALHNPAYDFNDEAIPYGVGFFVAIALARLPQAQFRSET